MTAGVYHLIDELKSASGDNFRIVYKALKTAPRNAQGRIVKKALFALIEKLRDSHSP